MMGDATIESLLLQRGARLKGVGGHTGYARDRHELTRMICEDYPAFEALRNALLNARDGLDLEHVGVDPQSRHFVTALIEYDMLEQRKETLHVTETWAKRYMSGSWLEELAWLASNDAGADEAIFSQELSWKVGDFYGENEIDLIVRAGERLGFVSCKALQSEFRTDNRKHRNRLMDAVHEANNLVDHFGVPGEKAAVLVTSDLIDESRGAPRYAALMGKAAILDVRIIPLEELGWNKLVNALRDIVEGRKIDHSLESKLEAGNN